MLTTLNITNFLLIDHLELDFYSGLTVITGETGSGKSLIIDALMLIFGSRINGEVLHDSKNSAVLEAMFEVKGLALGFLEENDLVDLEQENNLICRRVIYPNSKSKFYINGHMVTATQMKSLANYLLDIHTQHASIKLLSLETQRKLLDEYANLTPEVVKLSDIYNQIKTLEQQLKDATNHLEELKFKQQILSEKIEDFKSLQLKKNEWLELEAKHKKLSHIDLITNELDAILNSISHSDTSLIRQFTRLQSRVGKIVEFLAEGKQVNSLLESIQVELQELENILSDSLNEVQFDKDDLVNIENRISTIFNLSRKHKIEPSKINEMLQKWQGELANLNQATNIDFLQEGLVQAQNFYLKLAHGISETRNAKAQELTNLVNDMIKQLAISGEFVIEVGKLEQFTSYGIDNINFKISFNKGMELKNLADTASGGELSRVALALYLSLSSHNSMQLVIFDEIDVGIGGRVAAIVGKLLKELGNSTQIICITHQPQSAGFADHHLKVSKETIHDKTISHIDYLKSKDERIHELSRMLSGLNITEATLKHASEMLIKAV